MDSNREGERGGTDGNPLLSQQRSQRVTVRRTDRTPPKVTNASTDQTHGGGGAVGCVYLSGNPGNTPSAGSPIVSKNTPASLCSHICLCVSLCVEQDNRRRARRTSNGATWLRRVSPNVPSVFCGSKNFCRETGGCPIPRAVPLSKVLKSD